ncbi:glycosyltransferase family 4 protein [Candidatus Dependentiae bacterium]|nr:glycosyltransferase family 4 protein [Candidatus Dependentiae bacterium]MBU4387018.1 glycosyltransferase family 4 protein [Candidatus Dependentiae bacterium]MCG2756099.1 glycosyltransferase family 4 protein [Candidatus Dependentiae bacterium]
MNIENLNIPFNFYKTEYVYFENKSFLYENEKPNILNICTVFKFDGLIMHALAQHKAHIKYGYNTLILLLTGSDLEKKLIQEKLPYYRFSPSKIFSPHRQPGITKIVKTIVEKHNITVINCNRHKEYLMLKKIENQNVKVILTRHSPSPLKSKYLTKFKNIICVDQNCIDKINLKCQKENLTNPKMQHLAPFFDEKESLNFDINKTTEKKEFFKKEFNIDLEDYPTIVMVACLRGYKNHPVMFNAIQKLIYEKNIPVNLLLCGDGYRKKELQNLAKKLKIEKYVYFLGFTNKRIEVMFHSDIKALTTKDEAFGIVLMEAALVKKPLIGPTNTGVVNTIKHGQTGLLFENGNSNDLVKQLEILIANPELRKKYGENAYNYVKENFISDVLIKKLDQFYKEI